VTGSVAWRKDRADRAELKAGLARNDKRVDREFAGAEITKSQAAGLHQPDRQTRPEERLVASRPIGE